MAKPKRVISEAEKADFDEFNAAFKVWWPHYKEAAQHCQPRSIAHSSFHAGYRSAPGFKRFHSVELDGVTYVPAEARPLEEEARKLLAEVYGNLYTEANYDPMNESTREFARPLWEKIKAANEILGFRR